MKYRHILAMVGGFALDAVLGDPQNWPHPVRLIGKQIDVEQQLVYDYLLPAAEEAGDSWPLDRAQTEKLGGAAIVADVTVLPALATAIVLKLCNKVHPALALAAETFLCYQLLAARSLCNESMHVRDVLATGDLPAAREAVGRIVGRDTDALDEAGVARATVETVAENTSDGVVAPLLFMGLGGAPTAMAYKAVNTLDSMIGYKTGRFANLGWAAAKLDDIVNIVPARMSGVLMCAAARILGMDSAGAWRIFLRDRYNHSSPNSAQTEAACAGALGVQLGGGNTYFGEYVEKPTIGDDTRPVEAVDIERANKLMYATAILGLGAAAVCGLVSGRRSR